MLTTLKRCLLCALALVPAQPALAQSAPLDLICSWASPSLDRVPAPGGGEGYLKRSLVFEAASEKLRVETFADAEASAQFPRNVNVVPAAFS